MKRVHVYIILFLLVMVHGRCVKEFDPSSQGYENLLVIEALLSNSDDNFTVKLSRSIPLDTTAFVGEAGANIQLVSELGEQFALFETSSGIYESSGPINPVVGVGYKLEVQTRNNKNYESEVVTMRDTPPIEELSYKIEERPSAGLTGIQFYVTAQDPQNNTWFYRWEWEETWIFRVPFRSYLKYEDGEIKNREEDLRTCWKAGRSTSLDVATSKNLTKDIINEYPLYYVSSETDRLRERYSFNVRQYSLSEESFNYWNELKKATENLGTLFDPQPSIVKGNYYNVDDESEIVLGYFDAAVVRQQRIFVVRSDVPEFEIINKYRDCEDSLVSENMVPVMVAEGWEMINSEVVEFSILYSFSTRFCVDCTLYGTNMRPDFW